ncbi:MAG: helix-turn-helix domain-containing protein [Ktedonobacterales bacterium]
MRQTMGKRLDYAPQATMANVGVSAATEQAGISKLLLRVESVADMLDLSVDTVYKLAKEGEIGAVKVRASLRFPRIAVEQYVARLCREQGVEVDA